MQVLFPRLTVLDVLLHLTKIIALPIAAHMAVTSTKDSSLMTIWLTKQTLALDVRVSLLLHC